MHVRQQTRGDHCGFAQVLQGASHSGQREGCVSRSRDHANESLTQFLASCASQTDAARTSQLCESPTVITNVHRDSDCKLGQLADAPDVIEMMAAVRTADLLCKVGCLMIRCEKSIVWPACYKDGCHSILSELTTTVCQVRPRERVL